MAAFLEAFRDIETPEPLYSCSSCGRKFISDTLKRHESICTKLKKRKPFDSFQQRIGGIAEHDKEKVLRPSPIPKTKKNNWKQKHEDFLYTVRSARGFSSDIKKGSSLAPPPPQRIDPDLLQCPHCSRRFNQHSADRHIAFCKEQKSRIGKSPKSVSSLAAQRVAARTQYKPPPLAKRSPSGTTPSSAGKRQTKTKYDTPTPPEPSRVLRHDELILPGTKKGKNTKALKSRYDSEQTSATNFGDTSRIESNFNFNGKQAGKAYHSNRYKTIDNHMETVGSNYERDFTKLKEIKYGRRTCKTQECDGPLDLEPVETRGFSPLSGTQDKINGHGSVKGTNSNTTVRDASPPVVDDSITFDKSSSVRRKNPFPLKPFCKAQVHKPYVKDYQSNHTEDQKRLSKCCHECGTKYPVTSAKFCCECGTKRLCIS